MWSFENGTADIDPELCFHVQSIQSLLDPEYWKKLCPFLSISDSGSDEDSAIRSSSLSKCRDADCAALRSADALGVALTDRGYFRLPSGELNFSHELFDRLAVGVRRLVAYGYPPTFILMYDEVWLVGDHINTIMTATSGNNPIGDWFVFYVDPLADNGYMPGPPHRDRPSAGLESFRQPGGEPKYCSVWVALTEASPESSCLYVVPRINDDGYVGPGDCIARSGEGSPNWQNFVAQPLQVGGMLAFSHRLLHWGSNPQPHTILDSRSPSSLFPRIALTFAFADDTFENPYFDHARYLPHPPLGLRLGLIAGQQIQYEHLAPLHKHTISLYRRIIFSQKDFFNSEYFEKISSAIQMLLFQRSQEKGKVQPDSLETRATKLSLSMKPLTALADLLLPEPLTQVLTTALPTVSVLLAPVLAIAAVDTEVVTSLLLDLVNIVLPVPL